MPHAAADQRVPAQELAIRHEKCRRLLAETAPDAGGILAFSRQNIFYLSGTLGQGVMWLPMQGEPVLFIRKGIERAREESALRNVVPFRSYGDLAGLAEDAGSPFTEVAGAEQGGLTWQLAGLLTAKMPGVRFVSADAALSMAASLKSEWELDIMRRCGALHHKGLYELLPGMIRPGMTERELSHKAWEAFFSLGHMGLMRMQAFGEEIFLGHVSAGESGNYSSAFNGPLGLRGEHPAAPYMGSAQVVWEPGQPLGMDIGFTICGYCTDKTQTYWSGPAGSIPDEVARAHDFCIDVQAWAAERAKPGALPQDIYLESLELAEKAGMSEGFMGLGENKVPFLGHGIGLSIDGFPPLAKGFVRPLEEGMVLAIEPKHGIPGVGMVGVENTFEVRASGAVCITGDRYDMICVG